MEILTRRRQRQLKRSDFWLRRHLADIFHKSVLDRGRTRVPEFTEAEFNRQITPLLQDQSEILPED